MKKIGEILFFILAILITSCTKENLINNQLTEPIDEPKSLYVHNGILVFDSEETFNRTLEEINKMDDSERKNWEECLGFKSFNRAISEADKEQIAYQEKFDNYSIEELEGLIKNGEIEEYSPLTKQYIDRGIIKMVIDNNNEVSRVVNFPMYSSLVNIDGLVAVGNEILLYTKSKFKLIKSLDFSKIEQLKSINDNINDEDFFVTNIFSREKVTIGKIFEYSAESFTTDRQKVVATETYQYYDRKYDGRNYEANYTLLVENKLKIYKWFRWQWINDYDTRTWVWGDFDFKTKENGTYNVSLEYPDMLIAYTTITMIKREFNRYDYNSVDGGPEILRSTWNICRWGGSHGLGVRLIDHIRYERF